MFKPLMQPLWQRRAINPIDPLDYTFPEEVVARLVWPGGTVELISVNRMFPLMTVEWKYIVGNRQRWATVKEAVVDQQRAARRMLAQCGAGDSVLNAIASAGMAEVVITGPGDAQGFPWEFVIAAATREIRAGRALTVMRRLPSTLPALTGAPASLLYVQSAPGPLGALYSFESEQALVRASLPSCAWNELFDPTPAALAKTIGDVKPDVIHLAGFDAHQGLRLAGISESAPEDGYVLRDESKGIIAVNGAALAAMLTSGGHRPRLVSCSLWNSGRIVGPAIVEAGAAAAIGFQDTFDDTLGEAFFGAFYEAWARHGWDLSFAFVDAWTAMRNAGPSLLGSGVTLWSGAPLIDATIDATKAVAMRELSQAAGTRTGTGDGRIQRQRGFVGFGTGDGGVVDLDPDGMTAAQVAEVLKVTVEPLAELNYSLLHNHRPLFNQFKITQLKQGRVRDLNVTVDLFTGGESWPFRSSFEMKTNPLDLRENIHVTLTSALARSAREAVNTSLLVELKWKSHVLWSNTSPVRLLPPDQWRDDDKDRAWLPSFVLPRDPAITTLVDQAQRYVQVLRDDPALGFDGYQSVDSELEDPSEEIDLQVQAIWSGILHEWKLGYINPPPTYGRPVTSDAGHDSQRLRTPSMVLRQRAGTCIDLSLLFASALELVDIYPVIFLLQGHAFPGYWRSEEAHDEFVRATGAGESGARASREPNKTPWVVSSYAEVTRHVNAGNLVPLETVSLTAHTGFWDAVEQGRENLASKDEFHSMIDILKARTDLVTPLPIVEEP